MTATNSLDQTLRESFAYGSSAIPSDVYNIPRRTFLLGYPIAHSMAPLLHSTAFKQLSLPWTYELLETQDQSKFLPALKQPDIIGCAVTMPYKVSVIPSVDTVTEEGKMIGAINTVFLRKDADGTTKYIGTNTDCIGVREAFLQNFPGILEKSTGKPGLVIGGGGACRGSIYALWKWMGVSKIYLVNRLKEEIDVMMESFKDVGFDAELIWVGSAEEAAALESPVVIVGTIPDIPPKEEGELEVRKIFKSFLEREEKGYILEMCYHPSPRTEFYTLGEEAGWKMLFGTEAMIWQGVAQEVLWTETSFAKFNVEEGAGLIAQRLKLDQL